MNRTERMEFRATLAEKELLERAAEFAGMTAGQWIRVVTLQKSRELVGEKGSKK